MTFITLTAIDGVEIDVNMSEILYVKAHGQNSVLKPIHKGRYDPEPIYVAETPAEIRTLRKAAS